MMVLQQPISQQAYYNKLFLLDYFLEIASERSPVIARAIADYGNISVAAYLRRILTNSGQAYQSRSDLLDVVYHYAAPLLGDVVATQTCRQLEKFPIVLTANHQGVDFFAQSVQSSLLFALAMLSEGKPRSSTPIFSFGSIPLNNLTYPRGMLIYQMQGEHLASLPRKVPVFPDKFKKNLVSKAIAFDAAMLEKAMLNIEQMLTGGVICAQLANTVRAIIREDYACDAVLNLPTYSAQSVVLNNRIWQRLFANGQTAPYLCNLEIEKIVSGLLEKDLRNPDSLVWKVMFDATLRDYVLKALDGFKGCWNGNALAHRIQRPDSHRLQPSDSKTGTVFFWAIDDAGKHIPLTIAANKEGVDMLCGSDQKGRYWQTFFSPESVLENLRHQRLLPALFTCFLAIAFARGVNCVGGYYQAEYLPAMQRGLVDALKAAGNYDRLAALVAQVPTDTYLSGMQTVMFRISGDCLIPAGPLEIAAAGGLTAADIRKACAITVREAHLASLIETLPDVMFGFLNINNWKAPLMMEYGRMLKHRLVIK